MKSKKLQFSLLFLFFAGILTVHSQTIDSGIPQFTFQKVEDGAPFTNYSIEPGKKSIFILFDTSCSLCQDEIKSISKRYSDFKNINFYLISMDTRSAINGFMSKFGKHLKDKKNVMLLQDTSNDFVSKFKPTQFPAMYIYSEKQVLMHYFGGEKSVNNILKLIN